MICVDCFWQLSEQAIRLSWPRPWPEQTKLSCFYFQSTFAWPGLARMAISHGKFIACKFYKNLCQNSMHTKLSCNDNRISPSRGNGGSLGRVYPSIFWPLKGWHMLRERRSRKGQGLLRKEGPPTYAILSRNLVLSRFTRFLKGFHRVFNESHPAFIELTTEAILLSKSFQQKPSCFRRAFNKSHLAFVELSTKAILLS